MGGSDIGARSDDEDSGGEAPSDLADPSMDRYARLVSRTLDVPTASVTYVQLDRQVNVGAIGLGEETQRSRVVPLTHSFCKHVVAGTEPLVVEDAREHPALHDHPGIEDDGIIAYAGWPIHDHTGRVLGSLCAIDSRPHQWTPKQIAMLRDLADACSAELTARGQADVARAEADEARGRAEHDRTLLLLSEVMSSVHSRAQLVGAVDAAARVQVGADAGEVWLLDDHRHELVPAVEDQGGPSAVPVDATTELAQVLRSGVAAFVTADDGATAYLPLSSSGALLGVLELRWSDPGSITDRHRDRAPALARYCARAALRVASPEVGPAATAAVAGPRY